jgi:hypothetical protein
MLSGRVGLWRCVLCERSGLCQYQLLSAAERLRRPMLPEQPDVSEQPMLPGEPSLWIDLLPRWLALRE